MDGLNLWGTLAFALGLPAALAVGPLLILCRSLLRATVGAPYIRSLFRPVSLGILVGAATAILVAGLSFGAAAAATAGALLMLLSLSLMDTFWRWLPMPWVGGLAAALAYLAWSNGTILAGMAAAISGAVALRALQIFYRRTRGAEFLGTGDVILVGALGLFTGPFGLALLLGLASVTGLLSEVLLRARKNRPDRARYGVAFGTHLCAVFALLWFFNAF